MISIGLDIGGSTTKVIGFQGKELLKYTMVKAGDAITATYGGIGKFLSINELKLEDVETIYMTGVGSSHIKNEILGIKTETVNEFTALGLGGLYLSALDEAIVVSMGTGTSIVSANERGSQHIIGSGVGGGTLMGLSKAILQISDFALISELADKGSLQNIDLTIGDMSNEAIGHLTADVTASNFGKMNDNHSPEDIARAIVNLVFQSVGTTAILVSRLEKQEDIVFVGSLLRMKSGRETLQAFAKLYKKNILVPEKAEFSTAIGAALSGLTYEGERWKDENR